MMKHNNNGNPTERTLKHLDCDVQKITRILLTLARNDAAWWKENLFSLISQPFNSLKHHLAVLNDATLAEFNFAQPMEPKVSILEPLEGLVWLAALCQLDRILINALPQRFVELYDLQWRMLALHWLKTSL
jgi:hypothetical protein